MIVTFKGDQKKDGQRRSCHGHHKDTRKDKDHALPGEEELPGQCNSGTFMRANEVTENSDVKQ